MIIKNKKIAIVFVTTLLAYLLPEILAKDAMLYLTGGIIGNSIEEILEFFGINIQYHQGLVIWFLLLVATILLLFRLKKMFIKYITIVVVAMLLYVIDFILFEVLPKEIFNYSNVIDGIRIIYKSLILSTITVYGLSVKKSI